MSEIKTTEGGIEPISFNLHPVDSASITPEALYGILGDSENRFELWVQDKDGARRKVDTKNSYEGIEQYLDAHIQNDWYEYEMIGDKWFEALLAAPEGFPLVIAYGSEITSDGIDELIMASRFLIYIN